MSGRGKLIRFRRGTREQLIDSTEEWLAGEAGYITDEKVFLVADRDGSTGAQQFFEVSDAPGFTSGVIGYDFASGDLGAAIEVTATGVSGKPTPTVTQEGGHLFGHNLNYCTEISFAHGTPAESNGSGTVVFSSINNLTEINHAVNETLLSEGLQVSGCRSLELIKLDGVDVTAFGVSSVYVADCPRLEEIDLSLNVDLASVVLSELPSLSALSLTKCDIELDDLTAIKNSIPDLSGRTAGVINVAQTPAIIDVGYAAVKAAIVAKNWTVIDGL